MLERSSTDAGPAAGVSAAEESASRVLDTARLLAVVDGGASGSATVLSNEGVDVAASASPWVLPVASCVSIALALGLGATLLTEISLEVRVFSRRERHHQHDVCDEAASAITTWGHWLAGEAYAVAAIAAIVAIIARDYHQRRRAAETQWREQLEKVTADHRALQNILEAKLVERAEANERMERYVSHEIKNRLVILSQLCSEEAQLELVDEMAETLNEKMVLVWLASACYKARLDETMDLDSLVDKRLRRHRDANCPFVRVPTAGAAAAAAAALRLDALLVKIVFDNILSNAFKYGSTTRPPSLAIHLEPDGCAHVNLVIELTNWAGPEHAALLTMGEAELNRIAGAEGERAHVSTANTMSSGDGFPMAVVAARALGGTLRLRLSEAGVVAHLVLSGVGRASSTAVAAATEHIIGEARPVDPSLLMVAIADDSALQRKVFKKHIGKIAPQGPPVLVAGDTSESIDEFARVVCAADVDVVFTDQHFAPVHHTMAGTDIVREIRARDAAAGSLPRLVFVASGNDSAEDAAAYVAAGADGSLSKISSPQLSLLIERHATTAHPRFEARAQVPASSSGARGRASSAPNARKDDAGAAACGRQ